MNGFQYKDTQGMILIEEAKNSSDLEKHSHFEPGSPVLFDNQVIVGV